MSPASNWQRHRVRLDGHVDPVTDETDATVVTSAKDSAMWQVLYASDRLVIKRWRWKNNSGSNLIEFMIDVRQ